MLTNCQITPNQVSAGSTYSIKFAYVPNPTQTAIRGTITVNTLYAPPSCSIENARMSYVMSNQTLYLNVTILNSNTGFKYSWSCNPLTTNASCGVLATNQALANL